MVLRNPAHGIRTDLPVVLMSGPVVWDQKFPVQVVHYRCPKCGESVFLPYPARWPSPEEGPICPFHPSPMTYWMELEDSGLRMVQPCRFDRGWGKLRDNMPRGIQLWTKFRDHVAALGVQVDDDSSGRLSQDFKKGHAKAVALIGQAIQITIDEWRER